MGIGGIFLDFEDLHEVLSKNGVELEVVLEPVEDRVHEALDLSEGIVRLWERMEGTRGGRST